MTLARIALVALALACTTLACRTGEPAPNPAPGIAPPRAEAAPAAVPPAAAQPAPAPDAATLTAILATADAADGTTDNVVAKCAGCRLGMDGKAENAVQAHGYTLHFCSAECKALNEPKIDATIASLK